MSALVPLRQADASCGRKAATLSRLIAAGLAVPDGVVVRDLDGTWTRELAAALQRLGSRFALRSSAIDEDSPHASFAGQLRTLLDVPAEQVVQRVPEVAAGAADAAVYAAATGQSPMQRVAVLVQPMAAAVAAGVAFTRHPVTGARTTVVEAVRGRGDRLVSGEVTPQRWQRGRGGTGPDVLTTMQAERVAELAERVEELLGGGQDVEWALDADGALWLLQARPITTHARPALSGPPAPPSAGTARLLATGVAASPGTAQGPVRVLTGLDDFSRFEPGDVLACRATSPAWTPVLARAAAVVTERGGILSHAAIVARELGIPAVTDVPAATTLPEGRPVVIDGTAGSITALEKL